MSGLYIPLLLTNIGKALIDLFSILSMKNKIIPPTINLENKADEANHFNLVPNFSIEKKINYSLSNSFGFGGTNASLVFKHL